MAHFMTPMKFSCPHLGQVGFAASAVGGLKHMVSNSFSGLRYASSKSFTAPVLIDSFASMFERIFLVNPSFSKTTW